MVHIPEMRQLFSTIAKNEVVSYNDFIIQIFDSRQHVSSYEMRRIGFDLMDSGGEYDGGDKHVSAEEFTKLVEVAGLYSLYATFPTKYRLAYQHVKNFSPCEYFRCSDSLHHR